MEYIILVLILCSCATGGLPNSHFVETANQKYAENEAESEKSLIYYKSFCNETKLSSTNESLIRMVSRASCIDPVMSKQVIKSAYSKLAACKGKKKCMGSQLQKIFAVNQSKIVEIYSLGDSKLAYDSARDYVEANNFDSITFLVVFENNMQLSHDKSVMSNELEGSKKIVADEEIEISNNNAAQRRKAAFGEAMSAFGNSYKDYQDSHRTYNCTTIGNSTTCR